jgi:hypothetical protein
VISSFIVGSVKQAKRAESMQHEARGRVHNVPEEMGMDGVSRSTTARAQGQTGNGEGRETPHSEV